MDAQLKKGVLEMCLLTLIDHEDTYGYDLIRLLNEYFDEVNESTYYAILRRLQKLGYVITYYGHESGGPKRKYYKMSKKGKERLSVLRTHWKKLNHIVKEIGS